MQKDERHILQTGSLVVVTLTGVVTRVVVPEVLTVTLPCGVDRVTTSVIDEVGPEVVLMLLLEA